MHIRRSRAYLSSGLSRWISLLALLALLLAPDQGVLAVAVRPTPAEQAAEILDAMTPEERVGQLFLITFQGTAIDPETQVYDLIVNHHVGGVVLQNANDNFTDSSGETNTTISQVITLIRQLQQNKWRASSAGQTNPVTGETFSPTYIPLLVGISQEGNGYPYDQILSGLTPLPNEMAIGATWNPDLATQVGAILGQELAALGINLLLGPSLDVLENPEVGIGNNLGTRTFGGDPYWVAELGKAYIKGIHQGSQGSIMVVAKHFPGHGGSDRLPEEEVATVRKTFEELQNFDLAPFLAVTSRSAPAEEVVEGLLVSHIRYQGLQGNIRSTTRPLSFDPQALSLLLSISGLSAWHANGGIMVSDNLGSQAVRHFYELTNQTFDARRVALNAFLAGNDLLYLADFTSPGDADSYAGALRTLSFFAQKYREDQAFAQRVDESVMRLLTLKLKLYPEFQLEKVLEKNSQLDQLGAGGRVTFEVSRQAATLISPSIDELEVILPDPPDQNDRIVFITDVRTIVQCSQCAPVPVLGSSALRDTVLRLYGPQSTGQVTPRNLSAYTLADLQAMLDDTSADPALTNDLTTANWIVFSMLHGRTDIPSFQTLNRFLNERPALLQQKRLIVFAFCAPYFLDATNISKLTAYYALYDQTPQFVDTAAYLLFRELRPFGASPVSISGISYNLNEVLFPDSTQTIQLELDFPNGASSDGTLTPTPAPEFRLGDIIPVRTGVILDYNGNPVPDGTPVSFLFITGTEATAVRQVVNTRQGIARTTFAITASGNLEVRAESENARSISLKFDIPAPGELPNTPTPTEAPTTTPEPTSLPTPISGEPAPIQLPAQPGLLDWLAAVFVSGIIAAAAYQLGALSSQMRWGVRAAFLAVIGGLIFYSYLALGLPGSQALLETSVSRGVILSTVAGAILGLLGTVAWCVFSPYQMPRTSSKELSKPGSARQSQDQADQEQPAQDPDQ